MCMQSCAGAGTGGRARGALWLLGARGASLQAEGSSRREEGANLGRLALWWSPDSVAIMWLGQGRPRVSKGCAHRWDNKG